MVNGMMNGGRNAQIHDRSSIIVPQAAPLLATDQVQELLGGRASRLDGHGRGLLFLIDGFKDGQWDDERWSKRPNSRSLIDHCPTSGPAPGDGSGAGTARGSGEPARRSWPGSPVPDRRLQGWSMG